MTIRGSGITTEQMKAAPKGSVFVWVSHSSLSYANALAAHLGRSDLQITAQQILDDGGWRLRGRKYPAIIVDHAVPITDRQWAVLEKLRETIPKQQPQLSDHQ